MKSWENDSPFEVSLGVNANYSDFLLVTDGSGTSENPAVQPRLGCSAPELTASLKRELCRSVQARSHGRQINVAG